MINLIPKEDKKKMTMEFYFRLAVLFLLMGSFCICIATASLLPAYFLSVKKDSVASMKLAVQASEPVSTSGTQALATINDMNNKLSIVESAEANEFPISDKVINAVILNKISGIKITQILYENDPNTGKKVTIVGTATSRQILLAFQQALENDPAFKNVNLPISSFVKATNLQFSLNLTPA